MGKSNEVSFADMKISDQYSLVTDTALVARQSSQLRVFNGKHQGRRGIIIFMPGFNVVDGSVCPIEEVSSEASG